MKRILLGCILMVYLSSCQKEYSEQFVAYPNNALNSDTAWQAPKSQPMVIAALLTAPMIDSFDVASGGTIIFPENLTVTFPPNSCTVSGSTLTIPGKVKIEVTYLRKKGDFIRHGKPTTSYDYLLQSGGSFNVSLSKNGLPVQLAPGVSFKIKYRNTAPSNDMKFFYEAQWITAADTTSTWVQGTGNTGSMATWQQYDSASQSIIKGYEMTSTKLRWVNCDFFNDTTQPYTRLNVSLPLNFTNVNTSVYVVFKSKNIVAALKSDPVTKTFYLPRIPISSEVSLIAISKIANDYYWAKKEAVATNATLISLNPEAKSLTDINNFLNGL